MIDYSSYLFVFITIHSSLLLFLSTLLLCSVCFFHKLVIHFSYLYLFCFYLSPIYVSLPSICFCLSPIVGSSTLPPVTLFRCLFLWLFSTPPAWNFHRRLWQNEQTDQVCHSPWCAVKDLSDVYSSWWSRVDMIREGIWKARYVQGHGVKGDLFISLQ